MMTRAWPEGLCSRYAGTRARLEVVRLAEAVMRAVLQIARKVVETATCSEASRPHCRPSAGSRTLDIGGIYNESGRLDLNQRPLRPERSALSRLSYAPRRGAEGT